MCPMQPAMMGSNVCDSHPIIQLCNPDYLGFKTLSQLPKSVNRLTFAFNINKERAESTKILGVGEAGGRCNKKKSNEYKTKKEHGT